MQHIYDFVEQKIQSLRDYIDRKVYSIARYTFIAKSSPDGESDSVEGHPIRGAENSGNQVQEGARRLSGVWGVWSVPPQGQPAVALRMGGGATSSVIVACGDKRYAPTLADGETALYNKITGCVVKLDKNGAITITPAAGQVVNLGGAATDFLIKGTMFRAAQTIMDTSVGAAFTALATFMTSVNATPTLANIGAAAGTALTPMTTAATAVTTFETSVAQCLSTVVETI